jgi:hypothetical protein
MTFAPSIFPDGRGGAVSLTYDDGLPEHLDHAMPDLEAAGVRGTFYVPTMNTPAWPARRDDWAAAARRGHELGNHTRHHPCSIQHPWMRARPNFTLEAYNLARMEQELREASGDLAVADGVSGPRSFAYTCNEDFVGPERENYRPMVARLFPAARGGTGRVIADPYAVDLSFVPSWAVIMKDAAADMVAFIDEAIDRGGWAVLQFHGVGGGHNMNVPRDAHQAVCRHIADRGADVWCDTFLHVATHVRAATRRPWKG